MMPELQGFYESTENNPAVKTSGGRLILSCAVSSAMDECMRLLVVEYGDW
jgi:hypothetical protein